MIRSRIAGLLGGVALLAATVAATRAAADPYQDCRTAAAGVDPRLKACDAAELSRRDAQLNDAYRRLMAALPGVRQAKLRSAERAWVAFRDAECDFRASAETGGSDAPLVDAACRLELTAERLDALLKALKVARF